MGRPATNNEAVATRLTEAAFRVLADRGVEGVTVRGVATAAGCSTMAIYSLFGNKEALLDAAVAQAADYLVETLDRASSQGERDPRSCDRDDVRRQVGAIGMAYLAWARDNPCLFAALFGRRSLFVRSAEPGGDQGLAHPLVAAVTRAVAGAPLADDPRSIATTLWAGLHGVATLTADGAIDRMTADRAGYSLVSALVRDSEPH